MIPIIISSVGAPDPTVTEREAAFVDTILRLSVRRAYGDTGRGTQPALGVAIRTTFAVFGALELARSSAIRSAP